MKGYFKNFFSSYDMHNHFVKFGNTEKQEEEKQKEEE